MAEVVIAHATCALPASEMPEAQVYRLFGMAQIREHRGEQVRKIHGLGIAWERGKEEKGRGHEKLRRGLGREDTVGMFPSPSRNHNSPFRENGEDSQSDGCCACVLLGEH